MQATTETKTTNGLRIGGRVRLDAERVPAYLQENGLLAGKEIVDEGIVVQDLSRRNFNFSLNIGGKKGYLLKQVGTGASTKDFTQLHSEANMLHLLGNDPDFTAVAPFVPQLRYYDAGNGVVITELITPGTSLTKYHLNAGYVHFPTDAAGVIAHILAAYHSSGTKVVAEGRALAFKGRVPLGLAGFISEYGGAQGKAKKLYLEYAKNKAQYLRLHALSSDWSKQREMFHGDIRLDNFLLTAGEGPTGSLNLKLIDWEIAGIGDSIWDIAALMADYLRFWILCAANRNAKDVDDHFRVAPFKLEALAPFIGAFWKEYVQRRGWDEQEQAIRLAKLRQILPVQVLAQGWEYCANLSRERELEELPAFFYVSAKLSDHLETDWPTYAPSWLGLPGGAA